MRPVARRSVSMIATGEYSPLASAWRGRAARSVRCAQPLLLARRAHERVEADAALPRGHRAKTQEQLCAREGVRGRVVPQRALDPERGEPVVEAAAALRFGVWRESSGQRGEIEP